MVAITLSPEQVRAAPPEVRRWLEQQIAESLGFRRPPAVQAPRHLIGCDLETLRAVFGAIRTVPPVAAVFFELAREPAAQAPQGLRVLHVDDMMRHCRLQTPAQVIACLQALDRALREVTGDPDAALTVIDSNEHVLTPEVTARGVHALWEELVAPRATASAPPPQPAAGPAANVNAGQPYHPYAINVSPQVGGGGMPTA